MPPKTTKTFDEMTEEELTALSPSFAGIKEKLNVLQELGIDTTILKEKVSWAAHAQLVMSRVKTP